MTASSACRSRLIQIAGRAGGRAGGQEKIGASNINPSNVALSPIPYQVQYRTGTVPSDTVPYSTVQCYRSVDT